MVRTTEQIAKENAECFLCYLKSLHLRNGSATYDDEEPKLSSNIGDTILYTTLWNPQDELTVEFYKKDGTIIVSWSHGCTEENEANEFCDKMFNLNRPYSIERFVSSRKPYVLLEFRFKNYNGLCSFWSNNELPFVTGHEEEINNFMPSDDTEEPLTKEAF